MSTFTFMVVYLARQDLQLGLLGEELLVRVVERSQLPLQVDVVDEDHADQGQPGHHCDEERERSLVRRPKLRGEEVYLDHPEHATTS